MIAKNTALLLIDLQQGFYDEAYWGGHRNNPNCEQVCFELLSHWREQDLPIFTFVIHQPRPNHAYTPHIKVLIGLN